MKPKAICKMGVDIVMTVLLLFLMGYQFWGEKAHEWAGAVMFLLFIFHHVLNRAWYSTIWRGKYTPLRVVKLVLNLGLCSYGAAFRLALGHVS